MADLAAKRLDEVRERLLRGGVAPRHARRYVGELRDHLADLAGEEARAGAADVGAAALARLGGVEELAGAMLGRREFQGWSARAPWAVFGVAPVLAVSVAWFGACLILWAGWTMFLPELDTPFGARPLGLANLWFQAGKMLYFGAPVIAGWGVAVLALRQRVRTGWPVLGVALATWVGTLSVIRASRVAVPRGLGHISLQLSLWPVGRQVTDRLEYAAAILAMTLVPYLLWRWRGTIAA